MGTSVIAVHRPALGLAFALGLGIAVGVACQVENPDHCANQSRPGNDWCAARDPSTPFCSPCQGRNRGCVPYRPLTCEAYDPETHAGSSGSGGSSGG